MKIKPLFVLVSVLALSACSSTPPLLGVFEGKLLPCPASPNCVNSQIIGKEVNQIAPLIYLAGVDDAYHKLLEVLQSEPKVKIIESRADYIYVTYTSSFFGFVDDVEFYFVQPQPQSNLISIPKRPQDAFSARIYRLLGKALI